MQKFFGSAAVHAILAFLALILVSLALWFIGPLLAFGEMRPLAGTGVKITIIGLMLVFVILFLLKVTKSPVWVAGICFLLWHMGPLLAFGPLHPLEPEWVRAVIIGVILLVYAIWCVYKLLQLAASNESFANRLLGRNENSPKELAREDIRAIKELAGRAVSQLKQMHITMAGGTGSIWAGLRRMVEGKRYLYELPWYMVIGTPGSGKTSVLLNSGLKFPVAEQLAEVSAQLTLSQHSGTMNCAWWFTNEAVLVDTAGRYVDQRDGEGLALAAPTKKVAEPETAGKEGSTETPATPPKDLPPVTPEQHNRAEWRGFLGVLRNVRPRAPINGSFLVVDLSQLLTDNPAKATAHAAQLRGRLAELREGLAIRFPVYVLLTKTDLLRGFNEYFSSLTTEARAQVWGFTLPWEEHSRKTDAQPLGEQVLHHLGLLRKRISDGVATRLQEEFEQDRRQAMYLLQYELTALAPKLAELLEAVFSDSRFDTTQLTHSLRGVYFTSAMQFEHQNVGADSVALVPRLMRGLDKLMGRDSEAPARFRSEGAPSSTRSYFMTDLMLRVVIPEAGLVKPNLKWEARFRLLRLVGHALVALLFFWLFGALTLSHSNNGAYLDTVADNTRTLTAKLSDFIAQPNTNKMIGVLGLAQTLPTYTGLDLSSPSGSFRYGLYTGTEVADAAHRAYAKLQDRLILPVLTQRMEAVLRLAVQERDAKQAYDTLSVYLLLHDKERLAASPAATQEIRNWIVKDWQEGSVKDGAAKEVAEPKPADKPGAAKEVEPVKPHDGPSLASSFDNSTAMISHIEDMFSGVRVVQSATARDERLVRQVRAFLDTQSSSERLYQRTKAALAPQVPQDFTLVRALGPQAGTLFARASGQTLEKGVPGLFTYDGYHNLFAKRLPDLIAQAYADDAWVMGQVEATAAQKKNSGAEGLSGPGGSEKAQAAALVADIRRQYLAEYAEKWTAFLGDIRVLATDSGSSLSNDLNMLRQFAAPDSPLVRLGRLAARETTLSRSLETRNDADKSIFDKANEQLDKKVAQVNTDLGLRPEQRAEREYVDDRFGALREVVTGQSGSVAKDAVAGKPAMDGISNLLNEYYTALVVADAAITSGSLPPAGVESANKIKIEASKLPAPFREVLLGISLNGADKVALGAAGILRKQAQAQMDRLVGMLAMTVGEPCKRSIAGRYPFAASTQEVAVEDFNAMFSAGGLADEYFNKYLLPLVDTSARPWRYKSPNTANALTGTEGLATGQPPAAASTGPTLTGELLKLLTQSGPNPDFFAQVAQIREVYFREPGAKRMAWKIDLAVQSLDPSVTELVINVDGQTQRYAHGPVQAMPILWPGPRGGTMTEVTAQPRIKADTSTISLRGPWSLLYLAERGRMVGGASAGKVALELSFDGRRTVLEMSSSGLNPLRNDLLKTFSCPGGAI